MRHPHHAVRPEGLLRDQVEDRLVRRTDHALVYEEGADLIAMCWDFERPGRGTVNNSREDKLDGPMWRKVFQERHCIVPATGYFEFTGPKGLKRTHLFTRADGAWMWIAGVWEESSEHGPCFSMTTTEPDETVLPFIVRPSAAPSLFQLQLRGAESTLLLRLAILGRGLVISEVSSRIRHADVVSEGLRKKRFRVEES